MIAYNHVHSNYDKNKGLSTIQVYIKITLPLFRHFDASQRIIACFLDACQSQVHKGVVQRVVKRLSDIK